MINIVAPNFATSQIRMFRVITLVACPNQLGLTGQVGG